MPISSRYDNRRFQGFLSRLQRLDAVVEEQARKVEGRAKLSVLDLAKTGRLYKRPNDGFHRASAPGEAPADDTGKLVSSIVTQRKSVLTWQVRVRAAYGLFLELGTRKIAPRPFLKPALDQQTRAFMSAIQKSLFGG